MIGPLKIRNRPLPKQKYESECHLCNWAFFKWKIEEAEAILLDHIETTHVNPPPPFDRTTARMPGR